MIRTGLKQCGMPQRMACDLCIILFYLGYGMIGGRSDDPDKDPTEYRLYNGQN